MKNIIYYFTGTGNSYATAKLIASILGNTELSRITKKTLNEKKIIQYDRIGFVYPVYMISIPKVVNEFAKSLEMNQDAYIFSVTTHGGMAGGASAQLNKTLVKKGLYLSASYDVPMPANNQTMYPPSTEGQIASTTEVAKKKILNIAEAIKNKEEHKVETSIASAFGPAISQIIIPPNSDKNFKVDERCNGCHVCSSVCPANNIVMNHGKPGWLHDCYRCTACLQLCPQHAIQFGNKTKEWGRYRHPDVQVRELMNTK